MSSMKLLPLLLRELRRLTTNLHVAPSELPVLTWCANRNAVAFSRTGSVPSGARCAKIRWQARHEGTATVDLTLLAAVFGIIFVAELPDKTALASLMLGTRYQPSFVFVGVAAAFTLHVIIAVAAGSVVSLAPRRIVETIVAVLFLAGAVVMLRRVDDYHPPVSAPQRESRSAGFWAVAATSFGVLFVAEFGDLTQLVTANLAAKYHDPLTVGVGAVLGLWAVGGLAVLGGRQLLRWIPLTWVSRIAALVMAVLGVFSAVHALAPA
ncbi:MAG: TMEM165/GDT1 family protein [Pseudonocardiaceae bacterium]